MPDILREVFGIFDKRYRDMGDGSHAEVVALGGTIQGGAGGLVHDVVTVTSAGVLAMDENPDRKYALLINDGDEVMYLALGDAAAEHYGIRINASGGSYEMNPAFNNLWLGAVYAIHGGTGDELLLVTEG